MGRSSESAGPRFTSVLRHLALQRKVVRAVTLINDHLTAWRIEEDGNNGGFVSRLLHDFSCLNAGCSRWFHSGKVNAHPKNKYLN